MGYITTHDNVKIFYRLVGSGSTTLLFIHPPGMGHITFKQQLPLSRNFRLLYIDLRGNGRSERNDTPISFHLLCNDIAEVCKTLQIENVIACGYSNGSSIALETALTHPHLIKGLVLAGAFPKVNSFTLYMEFLLGILTSKMNGISLIAKSISHAHAYTKGFEKEMENYFLMTNSQTLHEMYQEGLRYDCTARLHKISAPIQLVYGQNDHYVHHYINEFLAYLPQSKITFIGGAKHHLPTKHFNEFNTIISDFALKVKSLD
ncbi:AB hydrolase superfamily protein YvaM [Bacillus sp. THAF10]|uniref:alpha/beta fold hydrolase n=1 Tax=Bacillus sp. THAF10 TaxID=2587848 RepID=UPI00126927C0|nr:alpha/beta hydrolase [Bacillus sp. THAF10]QFT88560.1 AB hydrolase superfamily protein YvaM [Bacillus sp. THAF10]